MDAVYVLNRNLESIAMIDTYNSLIWASRYRDVGDCELYLPATTEALAVLKKGNYLMREDDEMVCQIKYIELKTDVEDGNFLIVKGVDVKGWLDQRIVWNTMMSKGSLEDFIKEMVDGALGNTTEERQMVNERGERIFFIGETVGFPVKLQTQVSYRNIGAKVRDYCLTYGWGYTVELKNGAFYFNLTEGTDRTDKVVFSEEYENLAATSYIEDETNMGNVALIAGEGEGAARSKQRCGEASSDSRYEIFVDAKDISKTITYEELIKEFPGGHIVNLEYKVNALDIQIMTELQAAELAEEFPDGHIVIIDGVQYYRIPNAVVADTESNAPEDMDEVILRDVIYDVYLLARGFEKLAEYGAVTSFNGSIEPRTSFTYKKDFFLGDLVTVRSNYGISVGARITEVVEVNDDNGYSIEPKFEYIQED